MSLRVHHLSCGTLCPRGEYFVHGKGSFFGRAHIVCHVLVVETNEGLVLVDTGIGAGDMRDPARLGRAFVRRNAPNLDERDTAIAQVRALGHRAEDVRHLIPTHLDVDHAGGLPDFPEALVHVTRAELDAVSTPGERYRPAHFAHVPKWYPYTDAGESWFGFSAVRPLVGTGDDILLIPLFGHTPGHCGVVVKTAEGWLLHAGDAYFSHLEMRLENPKAPLGLALFQRRHSFDNVARLKNQERLRNLIRQHSTEVSIFSAHCPVELERAKGSVKLAS